MDYNLMHSAITEEKDTVHFRRSPAKTRVTSI